MSRLRCWYSKRHFSQFISLNKRFLFTTKKSSLPRLGASRDLNARRMKDNDYKLLMHLTPDKNKIPQHYYFAGVFLIKLPSNVVFSPLEVRATGLAWLVAGFKFRQ